MLNAQQPPSVPMKSPKPIALVFAAVLLGFGPRLFSQAVAVSMTVDASTISVGQTTAVHIYAQVVPNLRTNSERIFSWYVDVLNTNGAAASANYDSMQKTASDRDPQTSSTGTTQGANRRGIYDTFLNRPGAGVTNQVEIISFPVTGLAGGRTRFRVQAGSGAALSSDFQVTSKDGSQVFTGGDYTGAFVDLTVNDTGTCSPSLNLTRVTNGGSPGGTFQLSFTPCAGRNNTVEARAALGDAPGWVALPGAPHNSGAVTVTNSVSQRYFRLRITP
jgi:hypothetical protein